MNSSPTPKDVVVAGDITIDWNLLFFQSAADSTALWNASYRARACAQPGGVAMLAELLRRLAADANGVAQVPIHAVGVDAGAIHPSDLCYNHSYTIWHEFRQEPEKAWRVEQFLGIDPATGCDGRQKLPAAHDPAHAHLVVLDDAGLGFRRNRALWPAALAHAERPPWVLLKLSQPVRTGDLLTHLVTHHAPRLVVVVAANDVRLDEAQISRGLSWERVAQDALWELSYNPALQLLSQASHVVISFRADGAVLISRTPAGLRCKLFFDPKNVENGWAMGVKGGMVGYNTCLTAALADRLLDLPADADTADLASACAPAVEQGIRAGLRAMRELHKAGYENVGQGSDDVRIIFPFGRVADAIREAPFDEKVAKARKSEPPFAMAAIPAPLEGIGAGPCGPTLNHGGSFTILSQYCAEDLLPLARAIVRKGPDKALSEVPTARFGKFLTVDRNEIEAYRTVAALMQEYMSQEAADKPLSIAVFGAPGSGKSFGIKQIAKSLSDRVQELTFNLSQMNSPDDLIGALHQVRDEGLRGKVPLVFWDEFDCTLQETRLGWLRYFLAPMQDGSFLEGQVTHPIGRAIFVFAGGTAERMEDFGKHLDDDPKLNARRFVAVKGPDFKSRLKGFVDILGPNRRSGCYDPYYVVRRAILLQAILKNLAPQVVAHGLQMDDQLLDAFLETRTYKFGVRSMEAIVGMSQLAGKSRFERSSLPPIPQLDLHVVAWDFMARVQKLNLAAPGAGAQARLASHSALDTLARAVHEDFCGYMAQQGYQYGPVTDSDARTHSSLKPFDELPAEEQAQNAQNALDIARKLSEAGYVMIQARTNEPPGVFPDKDLERLAEMEHNRWMHAKLAQAANPPWRYGPATDKQAHVHQDLLPWRALPEDELAETFSADELARMGRIELSEEAKAKDREFIRRIPFILARVGYTVVKLAGAE